MGNPGKIHSYSGQIVYIFCMKVFLCPLVILMVNADLLICEAGKKLLHRVITEPVYWFCAFEKMESVSCVYYRPSVSGMGGQPCHDATHGSVAVNQLKLLLFHNGL